MVNQQSFFSKAIHSIDAWLWRHGFRMEKVRLVVRTLFLLNLALLILGVLTAYFSLQILSFALASLISGLSFVSMAKNIIFKFPVGGARKVTFSSLLSWMIRLVLVLVLSLGAIILLQMPPLAWFAGLGTPILIMPLGLMFGKE